MFTAGGGKISWSVVSDDSKVKKISDINGKAVFEVPYGVADTVLQPW